MRLGTRFLATASIAFAVGVLPAAAQEGLDWIVGDAPGFPSLAYGIPMSDYIVLSLSCGGEVPGVAVAFDYEPIAAKDGMKLAMDIFSDGGHLLLEATAFYLEMLGGYQLEAATPPDAAFAAILTTGATLSIMVEDGVQEIPTPPREAAEKFIAACAALA